MIALFDLLEWVRAVNTAHPGTEVFIDEGGLTLQTKEGAYLEVGGQREEEVEIVLCK